MKKERKEGKRHQGSRRCGVRKKTKLKKQRLRGGGEVQGKRRQLGQEKKRRGG